MTTANRIDQLVDALNRRRMGVEYEPGSSPPWAHVVVANASERCLLSRRQ
jgi:hypothetical protein